MIKNIPTCKGNTEIALAHWVNPGFPGRVASFYDNLLLGAFSISQICFHPFTNTLSLWFFTYKWQIRWAWIRWIQVVPPAHTLLQHCLVIHCFILGLDKGWAAQAALGSVLEWSQQLSRHTAGLLHTEEIYQICNFVKRNWSSKALYWVNQFQTVVCKQKDGPTYILLSQAQ